MQFVTMTVDVIDDMIEDVDEVLALTALPVGRQKLFGIRMSLMSLRKEAERAD